MANDPRKPKSWMNPGGGTAKNPAPSQKRVWHPTTATSKPTEKRKRSLLLPALAGAVLLGIIVVVILMWNTYRPGRMAVFGPSSANTLALPHNVGGANSVKAVAELTKAGGSRPKLVSEPSEAVKVDDWAEGLDGREDVIALFFCLHGGADGKGPFLWLVPPDAGMPDDKYKLRITEVLNKLKPLAEKKKKIVLFLDATQVTASLPHGMLHNDFVHELKKLEGQIESIPGLVVICASNEDQRSWYSEEWQRTVFAHFLVEGVNGEAKTDRVTVDKLFKFVEGRVSAWARSNRGEDQDPIFLPTKTGMERAAKIELASVSSSSYKSPKPDAAPGANFEVPAELAEAWKRCDDIRDKQSPEAIAPHRWRRYLDTLLRIESMLRAGAAKSDVLARLDVLRTKEAELVAGTWKDLISLPNAIAMPAALGSQLTQSSSGPIRVRQLLDDPVNAWQALKSNAEGDALTRLQLDTCSKLIDFLIAEKDPNDLAKAAKVLKTIFGTDSVPTEAHLILILDRDLDPARPDWNNLKLALETHRLAERVALTGDAPAEEFAFAELVFPWIRDAIKIADDERLRGEDFLISSILTDWPKATERLNKAKLQYEAISKQAGQIRLALAVRNKAFAELPYFARWVAGIRDEFEGDAERPEKLLKLVESIGEGMHKLNNLLEESDPGKLAEINRTAGSVKSGIDDLRVAFFSVVGKLGGEALVSTWHHIDNALQVPFIPNKQRKQLLENLRSISHSLNVKYENPATPPPTKSADKAPERAQRQGRIAIALLGSSWINNPEMRDESNGVVKFKFDALQKMMEKSTSWRESVAAAGEQLGWHWRALATQVDARTEKANRDALNPAVEKLTRADSLARLLDSTTTLVTERDPVADYRRHRLHRFLLDQARRSMNANWGAADLAAEKAKLPSFAEETSRRFAQDAEKLIMMGADKNPTPEDGARLLAEVRPVFDALAKLAKYEVRAAKHILDITIAPRIRVDFTILPPEGQSAGYPVLRFKCGGQCSLPTDLTTNRRPMLAFVDQSQPKFDILQEVTIGSAPSKASSFVTAEVWHRGHRRSDTTIVNVNSDPSGSWAHLPPQGKAALYPRAGEDMRKGTIAILLDWTRSMTNEGHDKYTPAVNALEALLAGLPEGAKVAFMQFGDPDKDTTDKMAYPEPIIGSFCGPRNTIQRNELIKKLRANAPIRGAGHTPIARSVVEMARFLASDKSEAVKTIVVLTDGEDNVTNEPGEYLRKRLENHPVVVNMVFFLALKEEQKALDQFKPIKEMQPQGMLYTASDQDELSANLRDALIPRLVVLNERDSPLKNLETEGRSGVKVLPNSSGVSNPIKLERGSYGLRTARSDSTKMELTPGDRLLVEPYYDKDGRVAIRPMPYITMVVPDDFKNLRGTSKQAPDVLAAVADAHLVPREGREYDLDLLVLMERTNSPDPLRITRPDFAWIEVRAEGDDPQLAPRMASVENVNYLPCSAWRVRVPNWPKLPGKDSARQGSPKPVISVCWVNSWPIGHTLPRQAGQKLTEAFKGSINVGSENIKIENVSITNESLLVELGYKPGPPIVFVRTHGLKLTPRLTLEENHQFFDKVGKYTARFGRVDENLEGQAFELVFYNMEDLKNAAVKITLRPDFALDENPPLGQNTPAPIEIR